MTIVGRKQSPRVLLQGWSPDDLELLVPLFPTTKAIRRVGEVDQGDWDALVTSTGVFGDTEKHLFVVSVGGPLDAPDDRAGMSYGVEMGFLKEVLSTEFLIPDDLADPLKPLVQTLIEKLGEPPYQGIVESMVDWRGTTPPAGIVPFLSSRTGYALAGRYVRRGRQAECWALPREANDIRWIVAAFKHWSTIAPDRFPSDPDWKHAPQWRTPAEVAAGLDLEAVAAEREGLLSALAAREAEVVDRAATLRDAADRAERSLLSEQGEPLVATVLVALRSLGFEVRDMDAEYVNGPKREDLQASESSWVALVEVKGYRDGAKTNDLGKFTRYTELYMKEVQRPPDAKWYVVNQFMHEDPEMRPAPLRGADKDIEVFAEANGLICDTRDLLRLWLDVQAGRVAQAEARDALRTARGLFAWPPRGGTQT